jgi:hypothetical protein
MRHFRVADSGTPSRSDRYALNFRSSQQVQPMLSNALDVQHKSNGVLDRFFKVLNLGTEVSPR